MGKIKKAYKKASAAYAKWQKSQAGKAIGQYSSNYQWGIPMGEESISRRSPVRRRAVRPRTQIKYVYRPVRRRTQIRYAPRPRRMPVYYEPVRRRRKVYARKPVRKRHTKRQSSGSGYNYGFGLPFSTGDM